MSGAGLPVNRGRERALARLRQLATTLAKWNGLLGTEAATQRCWTKRGDGSPRAGAATGPGKENDRAGPSRGRGAADLGRMGGEMGG